ncbi:MAG: PAS domain S-box protein [Chitinophagaceae bacterium]
MLKAHKSIPALTRMGNQYFITTDEKLIITGISIYIVSITGKKAREWAGRPIRKFFLEDSMNAGQLISPDMVTTDPFYTWARIKLKSGITIATLWVVTPIFDPLMGKVTELQWTGCTVTEHSSTNPIHHLIFTASEYIGRDEDHLCTHLPPATPSGKSELAQVKRNRLADGLANIGTTYNVDKVLLFQCLRDNDNNIYLSQNHQWCAPANHSDAHFGFAYMVGARVQEVVALMLGGASYHSIVRETKNPYLRETLESQHIISVLLHPLFVNNEFWGIVCCGQCNLERHWTSAEIASIKSVVDNLEGSIEWKESDKIPINHGNTIKGNTDPSDVTMIINDSGYIVQVSKAITKMLGFTQDALVNKSTDSYIYPSDIKKFQIEVNRITADVEYKSFTNIRMRNNRNEWIWMEVEIRNKFADLAINGILILLSDQSGRQQLQHTISAYSVTVTRILNSITDGFVAVDKNFTIKFWNTVAEKVIGVKKEDIVGRILWEKYPDFLNSPLHQKLGKVIHDQTTFCFEQHVVFLERWFDATVYPYEDGLFIYFKDITVKKKQEMLQALEKKVLEVNSNSESTLKHTVDYFLEGLRTINPALLCSVLLLDESDKLIRHLSAPGLPAAYTEAIDKTPLGRNTGSFGEAMYTRKMVVVTDINTDLLWTNNKYLALQHGLQACWALPILNSAEEVMGSLVCYYTVPKAPTEEEVSLIERTGNLLKIIIENKRAEEKVLISNERFILATRASNEAIWDWDVKKDVLYWGEGFYNLFGYKADYKVNTFHFWQKHIHPDDREIVRKSIWDFIKNKILKTWVAEYRFKRSDGNYSTVINKGYLICDQKGDMLRMVGSMEDITERKRLERKVINQEIEKQKLVAQAVVDAQEKERAKISKELHDNVNQILSTAKLFLEVAKTNDKERINLMNRSAEHILHAINEIRNLSQSLVPPSISDIGFGESIKDLLENIAVTKTLNVKYNNVGDIENSINANQKLMLFRIVQEQVNNVLKHAEAKNLAVQISVDSVVIELVITDDGKGFDPALIRHKKGTGLSNITSRVDLYNGKVNIITAPGKGCKMIVNVVCIH